MEPIRAFIAIELPTELKLKLDQLQAKLRRDEPPGVKWVRPEGVHLTLKFLGNIAADTTPEIIKAMEESVQAVIPFHLVAQELGGFPSLKRLQVAWVGIAGELDRLGKLQRQLESNLAKLGFVPESRPFTPHLTLARLGEVVLPAERQRFGNLIASTSFEASDINVTSISLMKSRLTREGAIYSRLSLVTLKEPEDPARRLGKAI